MKLVTLKKRHEFLRVRGGARFQTAAFVLEAKKRPASGARGGCEPEGPRFGFTVTKRLGGAVKRNRIRRRLKAAISQTAETGARPDTDYVVVARAAAFDAAFSDLVDQFGKGFEVTARRNEGGGGGGRARPTSRRRERSTAGNQAADPTNTHSGRQCRSTVTR